MALLNDALKIIAPHLRGADVLSLGLPEILCTSREIEKLFGYKPTRFYGDMGWYGVHEPMPDPRELFEKIGAKLTCVDLLEVEGIDRVVDMNDPVDLGTFDLVIDPGTTEHVMNVGQALKNVANAVRVGGRAFHTPPVTMVNHGLWGFNPTTFHDWYGQNGWTVEVLTGWTREYDCEIRTIGRFTAPPDMSLFCLAKRNTADEMKWVTQSKYLIKSKKHKKAA